MKQKNPKFLATDSLKGLDLRYSSEITHPLAPASSKPLTVIPKSRVHKETPFVWRIGLFSFQLIPGYPLTSQPMEQPHPG
jgi:hypothetical protein